MASLERMRGFVGIEAKVKGIKKPPEGGFSALINKKTISLL